MVDTNWLNFKGQVVLVTGGGGAIGSKPALAFVQCGADLVLSDVDEAKLATTEKSVKALGRQTPVGAWSGSGPVWRSTPFRPVRPTPPSWQQSWPIKPFASTPAPGSRSAI